MSTLTESQIIEFIYNAYENDSDTWSATDTEYLTARNLCNMAIRRWEYLEGTKWTELYTKLSSAVDGTKTTTAGDYDVTCPTDMRIPPEVGKYVRIGGVEYVIVHPTKIDQLEDITGKFCYFTGSQKTGFTLNINPNITLSTGDTISYEYVKSATYFTAPASTTEMSNPMFIVHSVLHNLYRSDGLLNESREELQVAENILQEMKAEAQDIDEDILSGDTYGFGV